VGPSPRQRTAISRGTPMKFCYGCGRATPGDPLFCNCGKTYDVKLCPRFHSNSRWAEVCSKCGNRDLSTPQPRVSFWWRALEFVVRAFSGALLLFLSLAAVIAALKELLPRPEVQMSLVTIGILLLILWLLWAQLPEWFRKLVWRWLSRRRDRDGQDRRD
jgi:hypothetical protein